MNSKLNALITYAASRISERGTWQGIAFMLGLFGSHYASLDWGQCAAIGASISGALKIILPDVKAPGQSTNTVQLTVQQTPDNSVWRDLLKDNYMNAISIVTLIDSLFSAFESAFPKASQLHHVAAITQIVSAATVASNPEPGTVDPTVAALSQNLPAVVQAIQTVRAANAATPESTPA